MLASFNQILCKFRKADYVVYPPSGRYAYIYLSGTAVCVAAGVAAAAFTVKSYFQTVRGSVKALRSVIVNIRIKVQALPLIICI